MLNTEEYERIKMEKRLLEKINEAEDAVKMADGLKWMIWKIKEDSSMTQAIIADKTQASLRSIKRAMKLLSDTGKIERVGGKRDIPML